MIKNILLNIILSFSIICPKVYSQVSVDVQSLSDSQEESIIIQHKDVKITVGDLEIYAPFIYKGEIAPKQGYLVGIRDTVRMKDIVTGCQSSCDSLIEVIKIEYEDKLTQCQSSCDERIKIITTENNLLKSKNKSLAETLSSEKKSKIVWSIISVISGAGLSALIYQITK